MRPAPGRVPATASRSAGWPGDQGDTVRKALLVMRSEGQGGVARHFHEAGALAAYDGQPTGHSLQHGQTKTLKLAWVDEGVCRSIPIGQFCCRHKARKTHGVAQSQRLDLPERSCHSTSLWRPPAPGRRPGQPDLPVLANAQRHVRAVPGSCVAPACPGRADNAGVDPWRSGIVRWFAVVTRRKGRRNAVVDDRNLDWWYTETAFDIGCGLVADRNHTARTVGAGCAQACVVGAFEWGQFFGRAYEREIVDGDNPWYACRQRQHIDKTVHQIGAARSQLPRQEHLLPHDARQGTLQGQACAHEFDAGSHKGARMHKRSEMNGGRSSPAPVARARPEAGVRSC